MTGDGIVMGIMGRRIIKKRFLKKCKDSDRPIAALILDLKQRGLLDETLVFEENLEEHQCGKIVLGFKTL